MRTLSDEDIDKIVERLNKTFIEATKELRQENKQLKEELQKADSITQSCIFEGKEESTINFRECLKQLDLYKEVIEEVREYITSYSSIHTIQFGTEEDSLNDIELNKTLDEKTITEITNRYLKVHDKLLQILDKVKENK